MIYMCIFIIYTINAVICVIYFDCSFILLNFANLIAIYENYVHAIKLVEVWKGNFAIDISWAIRKLF